MLRNLLESVEQEISSMEHKQARKDSFYLNIDRAVENLLTKKLEGYTVYVSDNLKGTDSLRKIEIYQGQPEENEFSWNWKENKPCIQVAYKIKLTATDVIGTWNNHKEYNLKSFDFQYEYGENQFNYELSDKFQELNEQNDKEEMERKQQLIKSRETFIEFLEDMKQAVINNEDIRITRKNNVYGWDRDGIRSSENSFEGLLKAYDELMKLSRIEQD